LRGSQARRKSIVGRRAEEKSVWMSSASIEVISNTRNKHYAEWLTDYKNGNSRITKDRINVRECGAYGGEQMRPRNY
jgi:hypothetical protein